MSFACSSPAGGMLFGVSGLLLLLLLLLLKKQPKLVVTPLLLLVPSAPGRAPCSAQKCFAPRRGDRPPLTAPQSTLRNITVLICCIQWNTAPPPRTHTHTCTHTPPSHTCACAYAHTSTHARTHAHTCTYGHPSNTFLLPVVAVLPVDCLPAACW